MKSISMGKEATWKNTVTFAIPNALVVSLLKIGEVKQIALNSRRGGHAFSESWNEHHFPYFDEIPTGVIHYVMAPLMLATAVFIASGLFGMLFIKDEKHKQALPENVHSSLKMFLGVIGFNGGQDLLGEGVDGVLLSAVFASLGVVFAEFLTQQNGIQRMWAAVNNLVDGKSDLSTEEPATVSSRLDEYQSYLTVFAAAILTSICFSYSDEVALDMFNTLVRGSTDHALASGAVTGILAGAILTGMLLFLPERNKADTPIATPVCANQSWVVVSGARSDAPNPSVEGAQTGVGSSSASAAPYMPSSHVRVPAFPSPHPFGDTPAILGNDPFATTTYRLSPTAPSRNDQDRFSVWSNTSDGNIERIEAGMCPFF